MNFKQMTEKVKELSEELDENKQISKAISDRVRSITWEIKETFSLDILLKEFVGTKWQLVFSVPEQVLNTDIFLQIVEKTERFSNAMQAFNDNFKNISIDEDGFYFVAANASFRFVGMNSFEDVLEFTKKHGLELIITNEQKRILINAYREKIAESNKMIEIIGG